MSNEQPAQINQALDKNYEHVVYQIYNNNIT